MDVVVNLEVRPATFEACIVMDYFDQMAFVQWADAFGLQGVEWHDDWRGSNRCAVTFPIDV
jgi:hypothetical protein